MTFFITVDYIPPFHFGIISCASSHVDRQRCAQKALHVHRDGHSHPVCDAVLVDEDTCRYPAEHRHSCRQHYLELQWPVSAGHGQPHHVGERARPHDDRQRHRAHRVTVALRHCDHQALSAAERERPDGHCADRIGRAGDFEADACRRDAAACHHLLGVVDSRHPAWDVE